MQLPLPLPPAEDAPARASRVIRPRGLERTTFRLGGRNLDVVVGLAPGGDALEVRLTASPAGAGASTIALRVSHRAGRRFFALLATDSPEPVHWAMSPRLLPGDPREFFTYAERWAVEALLHGRGRAPGRALRAQVRGHLSAVARRFADAATVPAARAAASRFAAPVRTRVYRHALSAWGAQACRALPGALLFGLALGDREETIDASAALLAALAAGERAGPALDAALRAWAEALPAWAGRDDFTVGDRAAFAAAADVVAAPGAERARLLAAQRLLVRRAGPRVRPAVLLLPPPFRFAPEDIPARPADNAKWFEVLKVPRVTLLGEGARHPRPFLEAFSAFASRHAVSLATPPRGVALDTWLDAVCGAFHEQGRRPARNTDPARLVAAVDAEALVGRAPAWDLPEPAPIPEPAWPEPRPEPAPARGPADPRLPAGRPPPGWRRQERIRVLCATTFPAYADGEVEIAQVTTLEALRREGAQMHHCVGTYREAVEEGETVVLAARVGAQRLTISLARRPGGGWRLEQCAGFANRRPTEAEAAAVIRYLVDHGVQWVGGAIWGAY